MIGVAAMALYWILSLFVMGLSRLREYYADRRAVEFVGEGQRKLSEGLAKITMWAARYKVKHGGEVGNGAFKALFISDPDRADQDEVLISRGRYAVSDSQLVQEILSRKTGFGERLLELFSTHPNIAKRLRVLQGL